MRLPRNYQEVLDAGYVRDNDFRVTVGNLEQVAGCLVTAPHGGGIEPGTSEIARAIANVSSRAFYLLEGTRPKENGKLHIDSTGFDEPTFQELAAQCDFVLSVHGANGKAKGIILVGGLYEAGKALLIEYLSADLAAADIKAVDAVKHPRGAGIAGMSPQNLTNRGRRRQGVQLEFSEAARRVLFPELDSRAGREHPSSHLALLAAAIERALAELTAR